MAKDLAQELIVKPGSNIRLKDIDPDASPGWKNKESAAEQLVRNLEELRSLQYLLYAEAKRSLLIVLQGIDAGGKDGTIHHVMSGFNPQGARVTSFKVPAGEERQHDYLWRVHKVLPAFGEVGIFNRSHYEDVLVVRVHDLVPEPVWKKRYGHINHFEQMLVDSGTQIVKFFLYIDRDEQKRRFEERLKDPAKNWKFSIGDVEERKYWDAYAGAFEEAIEKCSTPWAPWYVIPANRKWFRNLAVSEIVISALKGMNLAYPKPNPENANLQFD
jgi:PPK2 family polyphosphate:nucleotide phosphotransferase